MARQLTPLGRVLLVLCGLSLLGYGLYKYGVLGNLRDMAGRLVPEAKRRESVVPERAELPEAPDSAPGSGGGVRVVPAAMPGTGPGCAQQPEVRMLVWAWNSQLGAMFANGGAQSTRGS